jgi:hypothetical protein
MMMAHQSATRTRRTPEFVEEGRELAQHVPRSNWITRVMIKSTGSLRSGSAMHFLSNLAVKESKSPLRAR